MFTQHLPALLLFLPLVSLFLIHTHTRTCYYARAQAYHQAIRCLPRHGGPCHRKLREKRGDAFMCAQTGSGRKHTGRNERDLLTSVAGFSSHEATYSKEEFSHGVSHKHTRYLFACICFPGIFSSVRDEKSLEFLVKGNQALIRPECIISHLLSIIFRRKAYMNI